MFLMLPMLFGLAAVAIPIVIHLLHRQKTRPVAWGAMQFLLETPIQKKRRQHIDHWLLMLARIAVLAFLAILLARPLIKSSKYNPLAGKAATDVAVVIDHSLSTGRQIGADTIFAQSVATVDKIAQQLRKSDSLSIVLAEHKSRNFTPVPVDDKQQVGRVLENLHKLKAGITDGPIADAVASARDVLNHGRNPRKVIIVLSDEQRSAWRVEDNGAWRRALGDRTTLVNRNVSMYEIPVAADAAAPTLPNVAITSLSVQPSLVGTSRPAQITATLTNSGAKDIPSAPTQLIVNGKVVGSQVVTGLPAGQSRTIRFDHTFTDLGSNWVKVQTDVTDALEADNSAVTAINVWQKLPVLVIDGQLTSAGNFRSSQFLAAALQPQEDAQTSLIQPKLLSVSDASALGSFDSFATVIVNDAAQLPSEMLARLYEYARAGHGVWFILGARTDAKFVSQDLARAGLFSAELKEIKKASPPPGVEIKDAQNPMISLVSASEKDALSGVVTSQWWQLVPKPGDSRTILAASTGDPLILEKNIGFNGGRVVVWATSVDGNWNNWNLATNFVPLVNETLYHLASPVTRNGRKQQLEANQAIEFSAEAPSSTPAAPATPPAPAVPPAPAIESVQITSPDGTNTSIRPILTGGKYVVSFNNTYTPGLYTMRFTPTGVPQPIYYGVGIDRRELDPAILSATDISWLKTQGYLQDRINVDGIPTALGTATPGTEIWPYLAFSVLGLLLLETLLTKRMVRLQSTVDVTTAGLPKSMPPLVEPNMANATA
ncbi:MAG TPA: BatA domain-containing protein [Tepidisphaeraceae bacterium]|jgi:hypothetical protein